MRLTGLLLLAPLALSGCVVPEPEAGQQGEPVDETTTVSQGMPALPGGAMSAEDRRACEGQGGTVERRGMAQTELCVTPYADAGKACTDGDQCDGRCIAEGQVGAPHGEPVTGICQRDDRLFGCFGIVEDGAIEAGLCVD
ncbi:hypothetical protein [Erythrobacter sp. SD-21]|uniref:hypothetical protein n=1 Tax=Erythrobacter sp. SD-21 TaxID=161528 RepID=UPI000153F9C3|nr:hypothetical protein [Erythrobacter sp. SD-21]EDL48119.1 hypothetical protein ED21_29771 [Erythrobacter sp. SD-21]